MSCVLTLVLSGCHSGIDGDSNVRCVEGTVTVKNFPNALDGVGDSKDSNSQKSIRAIISMGGSIGSKCTADGDCLYNSCKSNVCTAPALQCPTVLSGEPLVFASASPYFEVYPPSCSSSD